MTYATLRRRAAAAGTVASILAAVAACGSQGGGSVAAIPASSSPTPSAPVSATSTAPGASMAPGQAAAAKAALAAYQGMISDWVQAALTSNYQDPILSDHMSGSALSQITGHLFIEQTEKVVVRGTPQLLDITYGQMVPASNPTEVLINSCFDAKSWLEYTTDGHLYNDVPGGRHKAQALVTDQGGTWKVDQYASQPVGTC
jgi:hypothetical protein